MGCPLAWHGLLEISAEKEEIENGFASHLAFVQLLRRFYSNNLFHSQHLIGQVDNKQ
jgi:hypothetical protein